MLLGVGRNTMSFTRLWYFLFERKFTSAVATKHERFATDSSWEKCFFFSAKPFSMAMNLTEHWNQNSELSRCFPQEGNTVPLEVIIRKTKLVQDFIKNQPSVVQLGLERYSAPAVSSLHVPSAGWRDHWQQTGLCLSSGCGILSSGCHTSFTAQHTCNKVNNKLQLEPACFIFPNIPCFCGSLN